MKKIIFLTFLSALFIACSKPAGDGGNSKITGHVDIEYRLVVTNPATAQYTVAGADEEVFIVYGDHTSPDDRVFTDYNGDFEILNLRPGDYTLYVYSKDTSTTNSINPDRMPIIQTLEISDKKQTVIADDFLIYDKY